MGALDAAADPWTLVAGQTSGRTGLVCSVRTGASLQPAARISADGRSGVAPLGVHLRYLETSLDACLCANTAGRYSGPAR